MLLKLKYCSVTMGVEEVVLVRQLRLRGFMDRHSNLVREDR